MNDLHLRVFPDPVLRDKTRPVTVFDDSLKDFVADLVRIMHTEDGVGLAAPQVGVPLKLAVVFFEGVLHVLINPCVTSTEGEQTGEEGCLSFPGIYGTVVRPEKITLTCQDINGKNMTTEVSGFLARAFLHEMDHLDGKLLIDHFSPLKRSMVRKKLLRNASEPAEKHRGRKK